MEILIVIILVTIAATFFLLKLVSNKSSDNKVLVNIEPTNSRTVHYSDDFRPAKPVAIIEDNHVITSFLVAKEDSFVWKCPQCEVENPSSKDECLLCKHAR